jgi:phosphoribosylglycinamide formyltransferase-1
VESRRHGRDRAAFEAEVGAALAAHGIGLIVLAGFMRVLTEEFVRAWEGRMINVHPSLLPAFPGLDTHARALSAGVRLHGCTVHFVTPGVDEGPAIAQAAVPALPGDDAATLAARVLEQEHRLLPRGPGLGGAGRGGAGRWPGAPLARPGRGGRGTGEPLARGPRRT